MSTRVILRSPLGDQVVRDIVAGRWAEPAGDADQTLGHGLWAIPGLVDAHAHIAAHELNYLPGELKEAQERARESLRAGVTLILDKGWTDTTTIDVIKTLPSGERPDIEAAAKILAVAEGYYPNFAEEIDPSKVEDAVVEQAKAGAGWVKLIGDWPRRGIGPVGNFTLDELRRAVEAAEASGSRVAIHTMAREIPSMAVAAGVHSIEHGLFLTEADIAALGERGGMWVPTVLRVEATISQLGRDSSGGRLMEAGLRNIRTLLPLAAEAGVFVLAGTDLVGSPAIVSREAIRLGHMGLSNRQVLASVGSSGFVATGRPVDFRVGAKADAVLFKENPVDNIAVLAHPAVIIREGRLL